MKSIFLSLGTNVGDRLKNIKNTIIELKNILRVEKISYIYETEPWGYIDQNKFLNLCIQGSTNMSPQELLIEMKRLEEKIGREKTFQWGPRLIDIDILFYNDLVLQEEKLVLPHRGIEERAFVLIPLLDINPNFTHPIFNKSMLELSKNVSSDGIVRIDEQPYA